jgi:hypothetical protein
MPGGNQVVIDIFTKSPNECVSVMHMPEGESVIGYNGQNCWLDAEGF